MTWNLYENSEEGEKLLKPLCFSNGKTQEDVVKETLQAINEGHKVIFIHGMCGTGKCLEKNSLVFCKLKEEEYFGYHKISEIVGKEGKIISKNEKGHLIETNFRNVRKTGIKKLYKVKTKTGREIVLSKNHPLLTITENGPEWKALESLDSKSYICVPNKISLKKTFDYDENKLKILGHLIAEGKLGDKAGSPKYYQCPNQNPLIRKDYIDSLKKVFPDGTIKEKDKEITIKFDLKDTTKGTTNKLRLFVKEHGLDGKKSDQKFVPKIIFNLGNGQIAIFLSRLFSGDGCIYSREKQNVIEYSSISRRLIQDISILLNRFGILHTISSKNFMDREYSWRICISDQENLRRYIEEIGFIGRKQKQASKILSKLKKHKFTNIDKVPRILREYLKNKGYSFAELDRMLNLYEISSQRKFKNFKNIIKDKKITTPCVFKQGKIDFLRIHLRKLNETLKDENLSEICNEEIFWDKIKEIKFVKEDEVYDLEVPIYNNFLSEGIIVHNSAIALNIARDLGKTSVVVPIKNLQQQYKKDYEKNKFLKKENGENLKISVMTGRNNHKCKFLEDNENAIPKIKREVDSKLHDIFSGRKEEQKENFGNDISAANQNIPCKIEIKEKNWDKIKKYLKQNPRIDVKNFTKISDVKRLPVAAVCPYWSPVFPEEFDIKVLEEEKKRTYKGLRGKTFNFYQRKKGCPFYEQFNYYIDSDVIVFNSMKYILESALNRKPYTEAEIVDECDEFLDSFSNQRKINIDRLINSLGNIFATDEDNFKKILEAKEILQYLKKDKRINDSVYNREIIPLKETGIYDLFKILLWQSDFLEEVDEESYVMDVEKTASMFEKFLGESYVLFEKKDENLIANVVTVNLSKRFKEMVEKNKVIVLMSGTLHSEKVLKDIFGLDKFKIIQAEDVAPGEIFVMRTGKEFDCKYSNFSSEKYSREDYLRALDKCLENSKRPTLVHVHAFQDLPKDYEIYEYDLKNLISQDELSDEQKFDSNGEIISEFKSGKKEVLFSTRASRGVDFPGEQCNSIVFTKYPNPNVQDPFWKILNRTKPNEYWEFYRDKAKRELLQKVYRGLRFEEDKVEVWSPDLRVLEFFERVRE